MSIAYGDFDDTDVLFRAVVFVAGLSGNGIEHVETFNEFAIYGVVSIQVMATTYGRVGFPLLFGEQQVPGGGAHH